MEFRRKQAMATSYKWEYPYSLTWLVRFQSESKNILNNFLKQISRINWNNNSKKGNVHGQDNVANGVDRLELTNQTNSVAV